MLISVDALVGNIVKITTPLAYALKDYRTEVVYCRGARDALTIGHGQMKRTGYRHHSLHPVYFTGKTVHHPDNLASLAAVLHDRVKPARVARSVEEHDQLEMSIGESILLVGGPVWEGVTRLVFGYQPDISAELGLACNGLGLELPYRWHVDAEKIRGKAQRFVKTPQGYVAEGEPNWGITGPNNKIYFPTLDHEGFLVTDYLLLTKLPNFLSDPSMGDERIIVNFGGAHGIAQRAAELLLASRPVIRKVSEVLAIDVERASTWPVAYQALFRVGDITHSKSRGSRAKGIVLVDAIRIDESPLWWYAWHHRVKQSITNWR